MNDLLNDPKSIIGYLFGACMGLVMLIWRRHEADTKERLVRLEATAVRKDELAQLRADMDRRHTENSTKLDNINEGVTGTHRRIDELYRDIPNLVRKG